MQTVDEQPETIHLYVVREEAPKPQLFPIVFSVLALLVLVALAVVVPYQQPVTRAVIRVPAVLATEDIYGQGCCYSNWSRTYPSHRRARRADDHQWLDCRAKYTC